MAKTITLSVPHNLSEAELKSRMESAIAEARAKHPQILKHARESWTNDNRMEFHASAMGQSIAGRVDLRPRTVEISVELPFMLAMLANRVRPQIEAEARKVLGPPPAKAP